MRDRWYADNRDLTKWGVLLQLAESFAAQRIVQLAFYRPSKFGHLMIDGQRHDIPGEVIAHFRNLRAISDISSKVRVTVFDPIFEDRPTHTNAVLALLRAFARERCIVFLDPDTGLEPQNPSLDHVLNDEALTIWNDMKNDDVLVFYQHRTNRAGQPWIEAKRNQLADALRVRCDEIKMARAPDIANDVVLFFIQKCLPQHAVVGPAADADR
ncbi:MAG: hypothetical protein AB1761_13265 [Pseudomonadota bacterium]